MVEKPAPSPAAMPSNMKAVRRHDTRLIASTPFRLTVAYMGGFVVAAALIVGFVAWQANELMTGRVIETLGAEISALREHFQAGGRDRLIAAVEERVAQPGLNLYLLVDADGSKRAGNLAALPPELVRAGQGTLFMNGKRAAVGELVQVRGGMLLLVGRDIEDQRQFALSVGRVALWSFGLLSLLGVGAGILISRSTLGRIEAVTEASRKIMAGDLTRRLPFNGSGDELDRLSESLNAMLARIEELMAALREMSDNIAHDLKTPLTRLRSRAEAALEEPGSPEAHRAALVKTIEEADELIKTFNALLLIARLEGGAMTEAMAEVDAAAIVADVAELYGPVAEEAGLALTVSAPDSLTIVANRELVSLAIVNLLDNAIKYSVSAPAGGAPVEMALRRVGDEAEVVVADRGPGVAPEDRKRVLQRFVRLEKSRSRPGFGLGLSLVAAVARLHGGAIRLEDNAPGLKAVVTLPTRGPPRARHEASHGGSDGALSAKPGIA
jgi:signal transduction histidine kinase